VERNYLEERENNMFIVKSEKKGEEDKATFIYISEQ
jgi:hypothetical protein